MEIAIGIGLAVGIAGCGVGIGQGIAANGALNGMARQPEAIKPIQTAMLIALVFSELVFLLSFVLGFLLSGKIPAPGAGGEATGRMEEPASPLTGALELPSGHTVVLS